ncbi:tetratricopeptide repeat protein [Roseomonas sp. OT10]|uniref:tetratricopeptide repeat protein n=1 Tax=Roseomonas cutis TaxID=2897332 RepID=UPI001E39CF84|nr:tetratricopeptide repeat protein [Roseomonas sp. OT10]UFN50992.1 tetratricopeptide repeat protein [Roseomonas sp. OT10]
MPLMPPGAASSAGERRPGPEPGRVALLAARQARREGRTDEALEQGQRARALGPEDVRLAASFETFALLRDLDRFEEAAALGAALKAEQPASPRVETALASLARRQGDQQATLAHLREAVRLEAKGDLEPRFQLFAQLRDMDEAQEAAVLGAALKALAPASARVEAAMATLARRTGDLEQALTHLREAVRLEPADPEYRFQTLALLRDLDRFEEAAALGASLKAEQPASPRVETALASLARRQGDQQATLAHLREAVRLEAKGDLEPRFQLFAQLRDMDETQEATVLGAALKALAPASARVEAAMATLARRTGDLEQALTHLREAVRLEPADPEYRFQTLALLRDLDRFEDAAALGAALKAEQPASPRVETALASLARRQGDQQATLAHLREAVRLEAKDKSRFVLELAREHRAIGDLPEAEALTLQILAADPMHVAALTLLGQLALVKQEPEEALDLFHAVALLEPERPGHWVRVAQVMTDLDRFEAAVELLQERGRRHPSPELTAQLIAQLRAAGLTERALALGRQAAATEPKHFGIWQQWALVEGQLDDWEALDRCIAAAPATTPAERAHVAKTRGDAAAARWDLAESIAQYEEALAIHPNAHAAVTMLARQHLLALDIPATITALHRSVALGRGHRRLMGLPARPSQTMLGQILDEFLLDRPLLDQMVALRGQPPASRAAGLAALQAEAPDSTAVAISLMVALREAGLMGDGPAAPSDTPFPHKGREIPSSLGQYWDSRDPPPPLLTLRQSWFARHPAFSFRLFDDRGAREFLARHHPPAVLQAYRRAGHAAQKADLFRLAYLVVEGGWWADMDDRALAPLPWAYPEGTQLALYQEDVGTVGNNIIGTPPSHPVIARALAQGVEALNRGDRDILWLMTGPGLITRALAQEVAACGGALPAGTVVLSRNALFRSVAIHCRVGYKKTGRYWGRASFAQPAPRAPQAQASEASPETPPALVTA